MGKPLVRTVKCHEEFTFRHIPSGLDLMKIVAVGPIFRHSHQSLTLSIVYL